MSGDCHWDFFKGTQVLIKGMWSIFQATRTSRTSHGGPGAKPLVSLATGKCNIFLHLRTVQAESGTFSRMPLSRIHPTISTTDICYLIDVKMFLDIPTRQYFYNRADKDYFRFKDVARGDKHNSIKSPGRIFAALLPSSFSMLKNYH